MPADGAQYPGPSATIDIDVVTDDGEGVAVLAVELFVDGQLAAADAVDWPMQAPTSWTFAGAMFPEGEFTLTATATDWWGNIGQSDPVTFLVGDPPIGDGDGDPGDGDPGDGDSGDGDPGDGDGDAGTEESGGTEGATGAGEAGGNDGCSCNSSAPRSLYLAWAALAFLPLARRRRSSPR
jgi:MYXO-CTERM domain-containing protein